ncbi:MULTISPECIES: hypothetical protein [Gordonibacter]|uniref:Bacterial archaeo-eukaryotic release factor family 8 domain-containing protein n=1 Tax=Gordonibacter faecis TaxID=3047475 RepID=A0ABT7DIS3_9ACTN|nr:MULTISPECIES: hypothetical protein [unclassified Gordonibacter]MDJ1649425.1 hypothetical protein [Gordonibacter sp. KGMB12511]HIW75111.1 hypothetical protein [Candidatus Gordonibacter avicola]
MNDDITVAPDFDATLFEQAEGPLVSLYLPVDDRAAARIRLKELLQEVNDKLEQEFAHREHTGVDARLDQVIERFDELAEGAAGSIAVLVGNDRTLVYQLGYAVGPLAVVDDSFYVKPLLKNFAFGSHYVLLGLSADRFALIEGDFGSLRRWKFPEGLSDEFSELFPMVYDGLEGALDYESLENHMPPYHGYKSRNDVKKEEAEKFFRYVDKVVTERLLKDVDLPVILVSLPEHQAAFRRVSTLPHLLDEGIEKDVGGIGEPELLAEARVVIERAREAHARELLQLFGDAEAHGGASADPADIGLALVERKVRALFVAEDVYLPGGFNEETGAVVLFEQEPHERFQGPELADQFARAALAQDAEVLELPAEQMPNGASIAALYRY